MARSGWSGDGTHGAVGIDVWCREVSQHQEAHAVNLGLRSHQQLDEALDRTALAEHRTEW